MSQGFFMLATRRSTGELFQVYQATRADQVREGHEPGKWFFRYVDEPGPEPQSLPYESAAEAEAAVNVSLDWEDSDGGESQLEPDRATPAASRN